MWAPIGLVSVFVALLGAASAAAGQSPGPPLAPDHWAYELLDALDAAGAASSRSHHVRPVGVDVVRAELQRSVRYGFGGGDLAEAWLDRLVEHRPVGEADFALRVEAGLRDGSALLDPGSGAYGTGGVAAAVGRRAVVWAEGTVGGWKRFDGVRSGGGAVTLGPFAVMVARQPLQGTGPADTSPLIGSDIPHDALYVVSREALPLPWLEWLLGPVSWQAALAPWSGLGDTDDGWIGLVGASAEPHPRLRVGATRSATMARSSDEPVTVGRVLRTVFFTQNRPTHWDDQKLDLWVRLRWELFGQSFVSYAVGAEEDAPIYLDSGFLGGTKAVRLLGSGLWQLGWEYRAYGPRGYWCFWCERNPRGSKTSREQGNWYHHGPDAVTYERRGIPVGDDTGGYGAQHRVELAYWSTGARFRARAWSFFQVRDDERNLLYDRWPGKRRGVGVEAAAYPAPGLEVVGTTVFADGPAIEREWGLRLRAAWTYGGGW